MPYEFLEDTAIADVEFRAWGTDLPAVFASAAEATVNVMVRNPDNIQSRETRQLVLENPMLDMLLFDFLQEFIYYKDAERLLLKPGNIDITKTDVEYRLRCAAEGELLDPKRHEQGADVKAVTLHRFELKRTDDGWSAYVILDI